MRELVVPKPCEAAEPVATNRSGEDRKAKTAAAAAQSRVPTRWPEEQHHPEVARRSGVGVLVLARSG
jgi:hypothetical protein